jgi:hypothetical protein
MAEDGRIRGCRYIRRERAQTPTGCTSRCVSREAGRCRHRLPLCRFARSLRQLVNALEEFRSLGIEFISLHEGVDTSTPNGRLVFGIFASIAEFERELIRDRVGLPPFAQGSRLYQKMKKLGISRPVDQNETNDQSENARVRDGGIRRVNEVLSANYGLLRRPIMHSDVQRLREAE